MRPACRSLPRQFNVEFNNLGHIKYGRIIQKETPNKTSDDFLISRL